MYSPLLTDQYQLNMAYNYWKLGIAENMAVFHLSFRKLPKDCPYIVMAGLQQTIQFLNEFRFTESDLDYLARLRQNDQTPLLEPGFLQYLKKLRFNCDLNAVTEGTLVFAKEPVLRIKGPILQCQLLETPLLNFINFSSLIATKASLVYQAAEGDPVMEFGLRRAQGPDGGLTASRSAYIGGCTATSNLLAGKYFDIPVQGTQAHSWIMAFPSELEAFKEFAKLNGSKTVLLVDTYHTLKGVEHAIQIGLMLKAKGENLAAIRLDSGNLFELSVRARQQLDAAGLLSTQIIASGDLDEHQIRKLKAEKAPINGWGVGTRLVTSHDQPSLNAIYKLGAIKQSHGTWVYKMKISDDIDKSTLPGILQVKREKERDLIYHENPSEQQTKSGLLKPIFQEGQLCYQAPSIHETRNHCINEVQRFLKSASQPYSVILSQDLQELIEHCSE